MSFRPFLAAALILVLTGVATPGLAVVKTTVRTSSPLPTEPLDVVATPDGQRIFVLLKGGEVQIRVPSGVLKETIRVAPDAVALASSPRGDQLYVTRSGGKALEVVDVAFVHDLDLTDSPFKGLPDAPVVVATFNDYQ